MNIFQKISLFVSVSISLIANPSITEAQTKQNNGTDYSTQQHERNYGSGYYRGYNRYDPVYYYYRGKWYRRVPKVVMPTPPPKPPIVVPGPVPPVVKPNPKPNPVPPTAPKPPVTPTPIPKPPVTPTPTPPPISVPQSSGLITLHFDDGYKDVITNAAPILKQYGYSGDFAIIGLANTVYDPVGYSSDNAILAAYQTGVLNPVSHTQNHFDLATLSPAAAEKEMVDSQNNIQRITGVKPNVLVTPYCSSNATVKAIAAKYYKFVRNCGNNGNFKGSVDPLALDAFVIEKSTTLADIQARITDAKVNNKWLIISFHHVSDTETDDQTVKVADFRKIMEMIKVSGLQVKNTNEAYNAFTK